MVRKFRVRDLMVQLPEQASTQPELGPCQFFRSCFYYTQFCQWYISNIPWCELNHVTFINCPGHITITCPNNSLVWPTCPIPTRPITDTVTVLTEVTNDPTIFQNFGPEELVVVREQLQQALANLEAQQQIIATSMEPKTAAEADELIQHLSGALEEAQTIRAKFSQQVTRPINRLKYRY